MRAPTVSGETERTLQHLWNVLRARTSPLYSFLIKLKGCETNRKQEQLEQGGKNVQHSNRKYHNELTKCY